VTSRRRPPQLTPTIVGDDQQLSLAINVVLRRSRAHREHQQRAVELQDELRALVSPKAWTLFVRLETETTDQAADAQEELVRWAFEQGSGAGSEEGASDDPPAKNHPGRHGRQ
jgi:hypothetical protein